MKINGLDEKDNIIVSLLMKNARMSFTDIGEEVGLTRVAVKNRVKALEEKGVIKGYHAQIDPLVLPEMQTFVINVHTEPGAYDAIAEKLKAEKAMVTLCLTSGECRMHGICVVESLDEMKKFAKRVRTENPGLLRFAAYGVLDVLKGSVFPMNGMEHAYDYDSARE
jgi:DNA-binding Lrp family transcriptional regulator